MTAPNAEAVQNCIQYAIRDAEIDFTAIDVINGHLTATSKDALEIENWCKALNRFGTDFPYINSLKGMVGHCLSAAGSVELVASILQIKHQFIFPSINCGDLNPAILALISKDKIPQKTLYQPINILAKASFGFGDVNGCVILKKYNHESN
jgi:3-oxoacyl-(acyl-carrier-protein) synthase